jgi:hypothetical protein
METEGDVNRIQRGGSSKRWADVLPLAEVPLADLFSAGG